jgi:hypothetical protein
MKGRFVRRVAAVTLCLALSGCFGADGGSQLPSFTGSAPLPAAPANHTYPPSAGEEINNTAPVTEIKRPAEHSGSRTALKHIMPVAAATPAPSASATPAPAAVATPASPEPPIPEPTITLANGPSKERAQHLLDDTGAKMVRVDRGSLSADSATTYDQASNLLQAGRKAATEGDYVAASGFAEKAAALAAKLAPASP